MSKAATDICNFLNAALMINKPLVLIEKFIAFQNYLLAHTGIVNVLSVPFPRRNSRNLF